jgi:hypothetical protein
MGEIWSRAAEQDSNPKLTPLRSHTSLRREAGHPTSVSGYFRFHVAEENAGDYLTLSKLLWHRNIQTTIRKYGWMCNESSALCRMERVLDL